MGFHSDSGSLGASVSLLLSESEEESGVRPRNSGAFSFSSGVDPWSCIVSTAILCELETVVIVVKVGA